MTVQDEDESGEPLAGREAEAGSRRSGESASPPVGQSAAASAPAGGDGPGGGSEVEPSQRQASRSSGTSAASGRRSSSHRSFFSDQYTGDESLKLTRVQGTSPEHTHATSPESRRSRQPGVELGTVIDQRFVLEKLLGRGGMNVVYRARDLVKEQARDPNPYVAIKILGAEFSKNPEAWITLQRETKKAQSLAHPRIAMIHDFQIDRDTRLPFAQMEELHGDPLDKVLRKAKTGLEDAAEAARMVADIADGLAYAHRRGIVHCDLKPSNVFLTNDRELKILDFGIARVVPGSGEDDFDAGRMAALTPAYASCEMFERQPPHPADDVYALGVIAYELFTGRHPYEEALASRTPALRARELKLRVDKPSRMTRRQWQAVSASLALERSERPQNGTEFLRRFQPRSSLPLILSAVSLVLAIALVWAVWLRAPENGPKVPFEHLPASAQAEFNQSVEQGWIALRLGDYNGALQYFNSAFQLHPFNPRAQEGLDAIVDAVVEEPPGDGRAGLEAKLKQVSVLLSYEALSQRPELLQLRDRLQTRLKP